jgi:ribosomal protein S6--L-glutamate ligase
MKIAMLARNPGLYSHRRLKEAAEARGHTLDILNTLRCTVHIASHRPEVYYNGAPIAGYGDPAPVRDARHLVAE